jgi:hypothetical protein
MLRHMKKPGTKAKAVDLAAEPWPRLPKKHSQLLGDVRMSDGRMEHNPPFRRPKAEPPKADS